MATEQQAEFIESLGGELSAQQAAQLLEMDETDPVVEPATEPNAETVGKGDQGPAEGSEEAEPAEPDLTADNAVILAPDGRHTIDYQKLSDARSEAQRWRDEADAAKAELERLKAGGQPQPEQRAEQPDAVAEAVNPELFGDYSEEAIAKGIEQLVEQRVSRQVEAALAKVDAKLAPIQQTVSTAEATEHYRAIYEKHPDADSIAESNELAAWIATQPSFVRTGFEAVLQSGTAEEVIELFDAFKHASAARAAGTAMGAATKPDVKAAAQAVIDKAAPPVPVSLSDFPGGRIGGGSRDEAMADMNGHELLGAMETMTPEQIETFLNRRI